MTPLLNTVTLTFSLMYLYHKNTLFAWCHLRMIPNCILCFEPEIVETTIWVPENANFSHSFMSFVPVEWAIGKGAIIRGELDF